MIKKILTLSFAVATGLTASAQITITQNDIATIGTFIREAEDTLPAAGIGPGPAGANLTWSFSALDTHNIDTLLFTNPNWTPYAANFPSSNLAAETPDGIAYLDINSSGLSMIGQADPVSNMAQTVNPGELIVPFPATFGTSYTNSYYYEIKDAYTAVSGFDSIRIKHDVVKTGDVDAWGDVITPLGTFNSIRASEVQNHTDSVWLRSTGPFPPAGWMFALDSAMTIYHYKWWANGVGFPLVEMDSTAAAGVERVSWLMANPVVTGLASGLPVENGNLYPNPASDKVNIHIPSGNATRFFIFETTGKLVSTSDLSGTTTTIGIEALSAGMYFYIATDNDGSILQKGKFTKR